MKHQDENKKGNLFYDIEDDATIEKNLRGDPVLNSDDFRVAHIKKDLEYMKLYSSQLDSFQESMRQGDELLKAIKDGTIEPLSPESIARIHDAFEDTIKKLDDLGIPSVKPKETTQSYIEKIRSGTNANPNKNKP